MSAIYIERIYRPYIAKELKFLWNIQGIYRPYICPNLLLVREKTEEVISLGRGTSL